MSLPLRVTVARHGSKLPRAAALALVQLVLGGSPEPDTLLAAEVVLDAGNSGGRSTLIVPAEDEWSESPRHTDSIRVSGDYGIHLTVDYEDSLGRKETVKSFHRLSILRDGFEITTGFQSTKFPLNGRMSKRFENRPHTTMMNCFTLSTTNQIALECTLATKDDQCVGDFVWKLVVQFNQASECINVTTTQHGGRECDGERHRAGFRSTAFDCEKLAP